MPLWVILCCILVALVRHWVEEEQKATQSAEKEMNMKAEAKRLQVVNSRLTPEGWETLRRWGWKNLPPKPGV